MSRHPLPQTTDPEPLPARPAKTRPRHNLVEIATRLAEQHELWEPLVRYDPISRYYARLASEPDFEAWLLTWVPGQGTDWHDHGGSAGAFVVVRGELTERTATVSPVGPPRIVDEPRVLSDGSLRAFGTKHIHKVTNLGLEPAVSVHVYSPALVEMNSYAEDGPRAVADRLPAHRGELVSAAAHRGPSAVPLRPAWPVWSTPPALRRPTRSIDEVLSEARSRLVRLTAGQARQAYSERGAVLVDIRPAAQRAAEGELPEAVVIERNVLEWRFDPSCEARLPLRGVRPGGDRGLPGGLHLQPGRRRAAGPGDLARHRPDRWLRRLAHVRFRGRRGLRPGRECGLRPNHLGRGLQPDAAALPALIDLTAGRSGPAASHGSRPATPRRHTLPLACTGSGRRQMPAYECRPETSRLIPTKLNQKDATPIRAITAARVPRQPAVERACR